MSIKDGDKVKIEYTGKYEDGSVFDTSKHEDHNHPLEFEVGKNMIIKGLEDEIKGMENGQEKTVNVPKDKAYGERNDQLVVKIPKDKLPKDQEVKEGMMLMMSTQDGRQVPAAVKEVADTEITIDLNHPLAGKDLTFEVKVVDVQEGSGDTESQEPETENTEQASENPEDAEKKE